MHKQLFDELKKAIAELELMPGQMLPSTRDLAAHLGISRTTVVRAYEDLLAQGYVHAQDGVGTFVSQAPKRRSLPEINVDDAPLVLSQYAVRLMAAPAGILTSADQPALHYGASPPEQLPARAWRQILLKHCRETDPKTFDYGAQPFGNYELRLAIAEYLGRFRALQCRPEQVAVFAGTLDAPNLVAQMLIDPGDNVLVENPGFTFMRRRMASLGANIHPLPVDQDGVVVAALTAAPKSKLVYVTPSHQDPTGAVLSLSRRKELLDWARTTGTIIVEDDFDCEYRYAGSQLPAIQGLDESDRVVYLNSFWKTLFPLVSAGYLVVPASFVPFFSQAIRMREGAVNTCFSSLEQHALTEFINEGHLERHVRKTQPIYARRWQALVYALTASFKTQVVMDKEPSAMHLRVRFHLPLTDVRLVELARQARFAITSTASYYAQDALAGEFLIPFAHIEEAELKRGAEELAALVAEFA